MKTNASHANRSYLKIAMHHRMEVLVYVDGGRANEDDSVMVVGICDIMIMVVVVLRMMIMICYTGSISKSAGITCWELSSISGIVLTFVEVIHQKK